MRGIGIDAHDLPVEPAIAPPGFGIEKDLYPVAHLDFVCHITSLSPVCPEQKPERNDDHDASIDCPLRVAGHKTAWQNIDSL